MEVPAAFLLVLAFRKRSIDTAIDDGGGDEELVGQGVHG